METHPFFNRSAANYKNIPGGFFPEGMEVLIVGTFPPEKNYKDNPDYFFYPSPRSHFWNQIDSIFVNEPGYKPLKKTLHKNTDESFLENSLRKQEFAAKHHLGFVDVFTHVERAKTGSTQDKDLIPKGDIVDNGLLIKVIDEFSSLHRICCMYSLAFNTLLPYFSSAVDFRELKAPLAANGIKYASRNLEIVQLFPASRSRHLHELKVKQYAIFLFNHQLHSQ